MAVTLRARIAATAAAAVAVALVLAFAGLYVVTGRTLVGGVDRSLHELADEVIRLPDLRQALGPRPGRLGGAGGLVQIVTADGEVVTGRQTDVQLPADDRTVELAGTSGPSTRHRELRTVRIDGGRFRVLTMPTRFDVAVQVARPLDEVDEALGDLRRRLALFGVLGIGGAAVLGLVVARRAVRPVDDLTRLAEDVAATGDLTRRIDRGGDDEIGRLAATFDAMLASLEQARDAQEQLVADASHELRTPLTSLRTNIEVLAHAERLDPGQRRDLVRDVVVQLDEFGRLVSGLVELARGARPARGATRVDLHLLVERVVGRARAFAPDDVTIEFEATPSTVLAEEDRVERAVSNLVDNAVKYGGAPGRVEVSVTGGAVTIRDHGPGIPAAHLPHVFDRFYRAPEARAAPGSGLGLSIVRQVAEAHGGTVEARNADGGGAEVSLRLPVVPSPRD